MKMGAEILSSKTMHKRHGALENVFTYHVDMVLIDPDTTPPARFFSRNRFNIFAVHDADYGFESDERLPAYAMRDVFENAGFRDFELRLLTQPRVFGSLFNPVSFWLALKGDQILAFIAEVNNTFHERHFYLCHNPDSSAIRPEDEITVKKLFYVSPFQEIAGDYHFRVAFYPNSYSIRIDFQNGDEGVLATLCGARAPLSDRAILRAALVRPIGGLRVFGLIFYQALKLKTKGALYRVRPKPPKEEVSS